MSITIAQILKLPSLSQAKVIAGRKSLQHIVSSVSVLEYSIPSSLNDELFQKGEFQGGEVVISGLVNIKDDIEAQCACIKRLHEAGEIALILYYVGIFLPKVDNKVIALANSLDFPIICMPENRMDLRYSEVIFEVMEAIFNDQRENQIVVSEFLERIALLSPNQRSMDNVLRMLSDRMRCSIYILDSHNQLLNAVSWPRNPNITYTDVKEYINIQENKQVCINNRNLYIYKSLIQDQPTLPILLVKEEIELNTNDRKQIVEVIQLFINIWSKGHGQVKADELIRAILNDEPVKMRRLAQIMQIDVSSIHSMWIVRYKDNKKATLQRLQVKIEEFLLQHYHSVVSMVQGEYVIAFMGEERIEGNEKILLDFFKESIQEDIVLCSSLLLENTTSVRKAYLDILEYLDIALKVFPKKIIFSLQEIEFVKSIKQNLDSGEEYVQEILQVLHVDNKATEQYQELIETLSVYLLDSNMNMQETANQLYIHKNTVKYRLHIFQQKKVSNIYTLPEVYTYYQACALKRLLESK